MKKIFKYAFMNSFGTALYIVLVVNFIFLLNFWKVDGPKETLFAPIFMLMLLVFSVALVGSLIFGRPILWYLDGKKKDAIQLLIYTLGIFFVLVVTVFATLIILWKV